MPLVGSVFPAGAVNPFWVVARTNFGDNLAIRDQNYALEGDQCVFWAVVKTEGGEYKIIEKGKLLFYPSKPIRLVECLDR